MYAYVFTSTVIKTTPESFSSLPNMPSFFSRLISLIAYAMRSSMPSNIYIIIIHMYTCIYYGDDGHGGGDDKNDFIIVMVMMISLAIMMNW